MQWGPERIELEQKIKKLQATCEIVWPDYSPDDLEQEIRVPLRLKGCRVLPCNDSWGCPLVNQYPPQWMCNRLLLRRIDLFYKWASLFMGICQETTLKIAGFSLSETSGMPFG
jgi:hypothetical protein